MDNQNVDPNQTNQFPVVPPQQPAPIMPQNLAPRKPNVKAGLFWLSSPFLVIIGLIILITLLHVIKAPNSISSILGFLGGVAVLALFPIGIIRGIAKFTGK